MNTTSKWYAVYTKPKWEKKVAELLRRKGLSVYCPLNKLVKQWHDRRKLVEEPLFTSYVFVCIDRQQQVEVLRTSGVVNFVHWLGQPAVIRDEEIETVRNFLSQHKAVRLEKVDVRPKDQVRILQGPLMQMQGSVIEVSSHTVKVTLPSLGYSLVASLEKSNVEIIAPVYESMVRKDHVFRLGGA